MPLLAASFQPSIITYHQIKKRKEKPKRKPKRKGSDRKIVFMLFYLFSKEWEQESPEMEVQSLTRTTEN